MKLLIPLLVCMAVAFYVSHADSGSGSCSCEDEDSIEDNMEEEVASTYIITAESQKDLDKLLKKLSKKKDCKDAIVKSVVNELMFAATVKMSTDCVEEVHDWGYEIEPNALQFTDDISDPSSVDDIQSWGIDRIDQKFLPLDNEPFNIDGGDGVDVFILDTGVYTDHSEFGELGHKRAEFYADTFNMNNPTKGDPNGHGTRCASSAIGQTLGVARKAKVKSIRVANHQGTGSIEKSILGFDLVHQYAEEQSSDYKCVVSYSLTLPTTSKPLDEAVKKISQKCFVVVSAGNYGSGNDPDLADACNYSPGRSEHVFTIGASRLRVSQTEDHKAGFSNRGKCVTLFAPGHKLTVASSKGNTTVEISSGTSFSAPIVAGAAALLLSNGCSMAAVKSILVTTATKNLLQDLTEEHLFLNVEHEAFKHPGCVF
ncbi:subtilisin-like protease 1 [Lytechinus variegatus]|uniref:subtilisin-like protease 1 n=1 Tax=Lytechinus variegatus TaxID=7654 RepID=UPI001BB11911|nr:subtilisin-like protease 1 [Lytechinus variegatus]